MNKVEISSQAAISLEETAIWYENKSVGLGQEFLSDVEQCLKRIQARPELFAYLRPPLRKCIGRRFSFVLLYSYDEKLEQVFITGFWHQKQQF